MHFKGISFFLVLFLIAGSVGIGLTPQTSRASDEKIELGVANYIDSIAIHYLAKVILEDKMGYEAETMWGDLGPIFSSLSQQDIDAYLATWLPVTHGNYMDQYGDQLTDLGLTYEGALIGLVVPEYVEIDSLEELNEHKEKFDERIVGIDPGAGMMELTRDAIDDVYNLELDLVESSEPAMTAELSSAIDDGEWIVVTGWTPHWKFARWDLKFLDDPEKVFGEEETVHAKVHNAFPDEYPEVTEFFSNLYLEDEEYGSLIDIFNEADEGEEISAAREWIEDHQSLVESWIP